MKGLQVVFERLESGGDLPVPAYAHEDGDAGLDLSAAISRPFTLYPGKSATFPNGFALHMPPQHCGLVLSRSGLASEKKVFVLNAPGLIDPRYRKELKTILCNLGDEEYVVMPGSRIAQLLILPFERVLTTLGTVAQTDRGGLGSTGGF